VDAYPAQSLRIVAEGDPLVTRNSTKTHSTKEDLASHDFVDRLLLLQGFAQKPFGWAETEPEAVAPGSVAS
jgi:hypothetical protein